MQKERREMHRGRQQGKGWERGEESWCLCTLRVYQNWNSGKSRLKMWETHRQTWLQVQLLTASPTSKGVDSKSQSKIGVWICWENCRFVQRDGLHRAWAINHGKGAEAERYSKGQGTLRQLRGASMRQLEGRWESGRWKRRGKRPILAASWSSGKPASHPWKSGSKSELWPAGALHQPPKMSPIKRSCSKGLSLSLTQT